MKKKLKLTVSFVLILFLLILTSYVFNNGSGIVAEEIDLEIEGGNTISDFYKFGEVLELQSPKLKFNGKEYNAVPILYLPNGQAISKDNIQLSQPGVHVLKFSALLPSGREISKKYSFVVSEQLYSVESEKSSIRYGNPNKFATDQSGILLSLANGDTFTFNKIINLCEKNRSNNILRLFLIPNIIGLSDALYLHVRFTDIYDPTNYVTVTAKDASTEGPSGVGGIYMVAHSSEQLPAGVDAGNNSKVHINNQYGTGAHFPMAGVVKPGYQAKIGDLYFDVCWDYADKKIYGARWYTSGNNQLIADLDANYMNVPWMGFTTGEVIMSIYASGYNMSTMNMVITNINDENIDENSFMSNIPPELTVDTSDYGSGSGPFEAVVGKPFKLFYASAFSKYDKNIKITSSVYYNTGENEKINCNVENGHFTPQMAGSHTIVYTAVDKFGNSAVKEIAIDAINKTNQLYLYLVGEVSSGFSGQTVQVASQLGITNNTGNVNTTITATLKSDSNIKYQINNNDLTFVPYYSGIYDIEFRCSDYVEEKTLKRTLVISPGSKPIFDTLPSFPRYLIKGNKFALPQAVVYDISDGTPKRIGYSVSVYIDGSSQPETVSGNVYTVNAAQNVRFVYTASAAGQTQSFASETIPVIDTKTDNKIDITKYFKDINGSFNKTSYTDYVSLYTTQNLSKALFINPVQAYDFNLQFNPDGTNNRYSAVNIYLTDSFDSSICLKFTYIKKDSSVSNFKVNDTGFVYEIASNNFFGEGNSIFSLKYNNEKFQVFPSVSLPVNIKYDLSGNEFKGFPSNNVYVEIELLGVSGGSTLKVFKLNNQPICRISRDEIKPEIYVKPSFGDRKVGDVVTISPVYAYDVLNTYVSLKLYVTAPDGSYVVNEEGLTFNGIENPCDYYTFTINSHGQYVVYYSAIDGAANSVPYDYFVNVIDTVHPEITLSGGSETGKVNKSVKVASATATDNLSTAITVFVYVECPDGSIIYVQNNEFTPPTAGIYKVNYVTVIVKEEGGIKFYFQGDEDGNIGHKQYVIYVS